MHKDEEFTHYVLIPFSHSILWNEICADIIEVFGLPGSKFVASSSPGYLKIIFKSLKDKKLCEILLSEYL